MARKIKVAEMFYRTLKLPSSTKSTAVEINVDMIETEGNAIPTPMSVASSSQVENSISMRAALSSSQAALSSSQAASSS